MCGAMCQLLFLTKVLKAYGGCGLQLPPPSPAAAGLLEMLAGRLTNTAQPPPRVAASDNAEQLCGSTGSGGSACLRVDDAASVGRAAAEAQRAQRTWCAASSPAARLAVMRGFASRLESGDGAVIAEVRPVVRSKRGQARFRSLPSITYGARPRA